jgi:hypothetical protein
MKLIFSRHPLYGPVVVLDQSKNIVLTSFLQDEVRIGTAHLWFKSLMASVRNSSNTRVEIGAGNAHSLSALNHTVLITNQYIDPTIEENETSIEDWQLIEVVFFWHAFCTRDIENETCAIEILN